MGKRHRNRKSQAKPAPVYAATPMPATTASDWGWRGGSRASFDGAKFKGALRSEYSTGFDLDTEALRARSRMAYWDSTQARALLNRLAETVVGTGLTLRSTIAWELLGSTLTDEEKRKLCDEIDMRFKLYADSHEADATGRRNFSELQGFEFINELINGDQPSVFRYSGDSSRMSPLSIQFLDADQIRTVFDSDLRAQVEARGNILRDGVEITKAGEIVAIFSYDDLARKATRIPVKGQTRRFVNFPAIIDMPGQVRGVGPLASIVHELQQITDYRLAELAAAVANALIAGMIEPGPNNDTRTDLGKALGGGAQLRGSSSGSSSATSETGVEMRVDKPGMFIGGLKAGEKLASFDTKRPNVNFGEFESTVVRSLSASLSVPIETLEMKFSSNYSASRAALILFWLTVERWRGHVASQFLNQVYEAWLREEVALGRLSKLKALGFGSDPVATRAILQCEWIGDSMPSIDPLKDANAADVRIAQGATTRERVALEYNRSDYYENAARLKREAELLPAPPATAKSATVPPSDEPGNDDPADGSPNPNTPEGGDE